MSDSFNACISFLSSIDDASLKLCTKEQLQRIAESLRLNVPTKKECLIAIIRNTCPMVGTGKYFSGDQVMATFNFYYHQAKGIEGISNLLTNGPLGVYKTEYEFDSIAELENTNLKSEDYYILDTAENMKKRIRKFANFLADAPTKKVACVKLLTEEKRTQVSDFFKNLTSSLVEKQMKLEQALYNLQQSKEVQVATLSSFMKKFNQKSLDYLLSNLKEYCSRTLFPIDERAKYFDDAWASTSEDIEDYLKIGLSPQVADSVVGLKKLKNRLSNLVQDGKVVVSDFATYFSELDDQQLESLQLITGKKGLCRNELFKYLEGEFAMDKDSTSPPIVQYYLLH